MTPPLIALEEHFFSSDVPWALKARYTEQLNHIEGVLDKLTDLGQRRLHDMDAGGISLQVISHGPGLAIHGPTVCQLANDELALALRNEEGRSGGVDQSRFGGFAVLPMLDPKQAAEELRRTVTELRFVGALIDNHADGTFYDGEEYDIFWATVEELDVPVYLHPSWPSNEMVERSKGRFTDAAAQSMVSSGFGWHTETALHLLRLFASGLFDRRPRLKLVIGHMGETIPFLLERIDALSHRWGEFKRGFKQVYDENVWITTSGVWSLAPMRCILANTKVDHILYSVDYPFQSNENGLKFMKELEASGLVDEKQLRGIAYGNAEQLLKVRVPARGFSDTL